MYYSRGKTSSQAITTIITTIIITIQAFADNVLSRKIQYSMYYARGRANDLYECAKSVPNQKITIITSTTIIQSSVADNALSTEAKRMKWRKHCVTMYERGGASFPYQNQKARISATTIYFGQLLKKMATIYSRPVYKS